MTPENPVGLRGLPPAYRTKAIDHRRGSPTYGQSVVFVAFVEEEFDAALAAAEPRLDVETVTAAWTAAGAVTGRSDFLTELTRELNVRLAKESGR